MYNKLEADVMRYILDNKPLGVYACWTRIKNNSSLVNTNVARLAVYTLKSAGFSLEDVF